MNFKSPLAIYIIWHPSFKDGQKIADYLYSVFCRDSEKPLNRAIGIPVYFRKVNYKDQDFPKKINYNESIFNAIIPLIDDDFVTDKNYKSYIEDILSDSLANRGKTKVYPVAISKNAYGFSKLLGQLNFLRADKIEEKREFLTHNENNLFRYIRLNITHELCRLMLNMKKAVDEQESFEHLPPPIKLFISHSKHDDSKYEANKFKDFINSETQLKTFFDANDISFGSNFGDEIKRAIENSALVAFQSDSYAEREWCRIEVLTAKKHGCPVVIVNAIQNGEKRTFPYMGNYPSIRLKDNYEDIICLTLEQVLYNKYTRMLLDEITTLYGLRADSILSTTPELYSFLQLKDRKFEDNNDSAFKLIVYPDPPLGTEETELLLKMDNTYHFVTPTTIPSLILKKDD
ncbi:toll/interleukin-1 receptor domain-containing protein [Crocinitomix catalasitica]|uniref:toll/interleukin-1 receptor domain-containing protein n=1 Tax=Crocinitomix catalasitica TaxID=184607 RepID=UPI000486F610|nr:toll/interleukin-1 receptor domain-containing protein [Crocinitomix catalasitica]